ncbi:glutathione S-transferase family protein [Phenylobacterium sp.]|uniref:glutathione S-transferase family protein n=1 Tax=Phenylobacterium sp. TaxID=1871053 RepID=UPI002EDBAC15
MLRIYASGAARSQRVLWACEEVGAPYEVVEIAWPPGGDPDFLKINPAGTIPVLEDGPVRLIESLAICEYVSRTYGGDLTLDPGDPDYWDYLQLAQFGEATLQPPLAWARRFGPKDAQALEHSRQAFAMRLTVIEQRLADGREFLTAGRFTLADLSLGFVVTLARTIGLDDLLTPGVAAYRERLRARPAYRRAYGLVGAGNS